MNIVEMRRKHTRWNIEQNPSEIVIKRTERIDAGGYFDNEVSTVGPFVVRLYVTGGSPQKISTLAGEKQVDRYFALLADYAADIRAGTNVSDEFEADGIRFLVKAVYPQRVAGEITGYQCELERVS